MSHGKDHIRNLHISDYDYLLPEERIAKYPLAERDSSKLLVYGKGTISEAQFKDLPQILPPGHLLVFNNTKVIPARLRFQKATGANIEIFCLEPVDPADYLTSFQARECTWKCIVGNLKKWKEGTLVKKIEVNGQTIHLTASRTEDQKTHQLIHFTWDNKSLSFSEVIELAGVTPIPPYLNRDTEDIDYERYQTVYSRIQGSVAAPTAGLHFTDNLLNQLQQNSTSLAELTLHVGAGTFKPVQSEKIGEHEMHTEFFQVSVESLKNMMAHRGKIISVGTTTLRTLESLYWLGVKVSQGKTGNDAILHLKQWDAYELEATLEYHEALEILINYLEKNNQTDLYGYTQIMIAPGYKIKSIKALITNFHQPKSTLLLLVSAITGADWKRIYDYALNNDFRFLSYGDSSILFCE